MAAWYEVSQFPWLIPSETPGESLARGVASGAQVVSAFLEGKRTRMAQETQKLHHLHTAQEMQIRGLNIDEILRKRQDQISNRAGMQALTDYYAEGSENDSLQDPMWRSGLYKMASKYPALAETEFWGEMQKRLENSSKLAEQAKHWQDQAITSMQRADTAEQLAVIAQQKADLEQQKFEAGPKPTADMQNAQAITDLRQKADAIELDDPSEAQRLRQQADLIQQGKRSSTTLREQAANRWIDEQISSELETGSITEDQVDDRRLYWHSQFGPAGQFIGSRSSADSRMAEDLEKRIRAQEVRTARAEGMAKKLFKDKWQSDATYMAEKAALDILKAQKERPMTTDAGPASPAAPQTQPANRFKFTPGIGIHK